MKSEIKYITPEWAAHILETHNPKNRPIRQIDVDSYAGQMRSGRWLVTHQGIALDENGNLVDGQHRLSAVVKAGVAVKMMVTTDCPSVQGAFHTMDAIDDGRKRTPGQNLGLSHNIPNGALVAAISRALAGFYSNAHFTGVKISSSQSFDIYSLLSESIMAVVKKHHSCPRRSNAKVLAACAIFHSAYPVRALDFIDSYLTCIGWTATSPVKALDAFRSNNPILMGRIEAMHATAVALRAFHKNEGLQIVRINNSASDWLRNINPAFKQLLLEVMK